MSSATVYKWRSRYGGMDVSMMSRVNELDEENRRREMAMCGKGKGSKHQQGLPAVSRSCYRHEQKLSGENQRIADWLARDVPQPLAVPAVINQVWSMDSMHDSLQDGRSYRLFDVLDDFNREGLGIEVDLSQPSARVIRSLEQVIEWRGRPAAIRCDNGPEYLSGVLEEWSLRKRIRIDYLQPGKPQQHAYVERFNRIVRYNRLSQYLFGSIEGVQNAATRWLWTNNNERPNIALGGITPRQKLAMAA